MPKPLLRLFSSGAPPPPSPPPPPPPPPQPPQANTPDQSTLNADIARGIRLRKTVTRDRSGVDGNISSAGSSCFRGDKAEIDTAGDGAPQLAGMLVGGMPKLKSRGGVETGASSSSSYMSSPARSVSPSAPAAPAAPAVPTVPTVPPRPIPSSSSSSASSPSVWRRPPPVPANRPNSASHYRSAPASPPLPTSAPPRPPGFRKTSAPLLSETGRINTSTSHLRPPAPRAPSSLPTSSSASPLMRPAVVAARKATGNMHAGRTPPEPPSRPAPRRRREKTIYVVDDSRWRFKSEEDLPEPRMCDGVRKVYRSGGTGSTVPLDLGMLG